MVATGSANEALGSEIAMPMRLLPTSSAMITRRALRDTPLPWAGALGDGRPAPRPHASPLGWRAARRPLGPWAPPTRADFRDPPPSARQGRANARGTLRR